MAASSMEVSLAWHLLSVLVVVTWFQISLVYLDACILMMAAPADCLHSGR